MIEKRTTFDTSVVVVADEFEAPETAEPGIWTATRIAPAVAILEAGTTDVSWLLLTRRVFVRGLPFHKIIAPVTKPVPLAVSVNAGPPTVTEPGLTNDSVEEDV